MALNNPTAKQTKQGEVLLWLERYQAWVLKGRCHFDARYVEIGNTKTKASELTADIEFARKQATLTKAVATNALLARQFANHGREKEQQLLKLRYPCGNTGRRQVYLHAATARPRKRLGRNWRAKAKKPRADPPQQQQQQQPSPPPPQQPPPPQTPPRLSSQTGSPPPLNPVEQGHFLDLLASEQGSLPTPQPYPQANGAAADQTVAIGIPVPAEETSSDGLIATKVAGFDLTRLDSDSSTASNVSV